MKERVQKNLNAFLHYGNGISCAIEEHDLRPMLEKFTDYFNLDKIESLNYKGYCAGHGNKKSFCYYIQKGEYISKYGGPSEFGGMGFNFKNRQ